MSKRRVTSTDAVRAGDRKRKPFDAVPQPIVATAPYTFENSDEVVARAEGRLSHEREEYGRYGNPTTRAVEERLAALEGTEDAAMFASGMAAVSTAVLALVKRGDHVAIFSECYRMTRELAEKTLARFGVETTFVPMDASALAGALRSETRLVLAEMPSNPHLRCLDLGKIVETCRGRRGLKTMIDATFATPVNCRPAEFGADLIVHSATKYLGGHHDVLGGVVCGTGALVSVVRDLRGVLGPICDPHAAFLVGRGLKTLALRVEKQNASALAIAELLEARPEVERVFYPGLPSHPDHAIARAQMTGFGGVVSFVVRGGLEGARRFVDRLQIARIAPSFGGVDTLVEQPAVMSFYELTSEERATIGIEDGLVRLAVGIEEPVDLIEDLTRALSA
ncbi:MAG TPA: aminotransferase class I/II-fold pyridoxal phosphate-dependent enzyme [Polyangiaceae bacterium]